MLYLILIGDYMSTKFTYARRAKIEENIPYNYQRIDINTYTPNKPIVLDLGGSGTINDQATNGNMKIITSMLGGFADDVDVIGVNYNNGIENRYIDDNCIELVKRLLVPYVVKDGKRLDIDTACKNMRNVTIFAHCYGVVGIMSLVVPNLTVELLELGYNDEECKQIISQIVMVAYGSDFCDTIRDVKGVYFLSLSDEVFTFGAAHVAKQLIEKLDNINMVKTDRELLDQINTNNTIYSQVINFLRNHRRVYSLHEDNIVRLFAYGVYQTDGNIWETDHAISGMARNEDWSKHENASSTGDCVSRCLACVLCSSVANSIQNNQSTQHIEFDMDDLNQNIDNICKAHNYEQTKLDNVDLELL